MLDAGLMTSAGLAKVPPEVMDAAISGNIEMKGSVIPKILETPDALEKALATDMIANGNWQRFAPSHRKMYIYWIMDAKRPETRERRIAKVVEFARNNKKTMM